MDEQSALSGTYTGTPSLGQPTLVGSDQGNMSVSFGAVTQFVDYGNNYGFAPTGTFSAEAIIRPTTIDATVRRVIAKENATGTGWSIVVSNAAAGYSFAFIRTDGAGAEDDCLWNLYPPSINTTYHLSATYDGSNMHLYLNGIDSGATASTKDITNTARLLVAGTDKTGRNFLGQIDEVAIYNTALSQARVQAHVAAMPLNLFSPDRMPLGV